MEIALEGGEDLRVFATISKETIAIAVVTARTTSGQALMAVQGAQPGEPEGLRGERPRLDGLEGPGPLSPGVADGSEGGARVEGRPKPTEDEILPHHERDPENRFGWRSM